MVRSSIFSANTPVASGGLSLKISVIINTKDSGRTVAYGLRSVQEFADEIVVMDMESTDDTVAIAREHGAHVVSIPTHPIAETTRDLALGYVSGDWVLILDGDELAAPRLVSTLREVVDADTADVVRIPMVNYLLGARLRFTSWSPRHDRHWRFFKPGTLTWTSQVHTMPLVNEGARTVELDDRRDGVLVHLSYVDTSDFLIRLDRYTSLEADRLEHRPWSPIAAVWSMAREVLARFVLRQGFREGWRGVHLTLLMVVYRSISHVKHWERERVGERHEVEERYAEAAEAWLRGDHTP